MAVALAALLGAACTFDFDAGDYTYPGEAPTACRAAADCAGRAAVPCGTWVCGEDGRCAQQPAEDGSACEDGDPCTTGSACTGGACAGGAASCDDGLACTVDECDPGTGECAHAPDDGLCGGGGPCLVPRCDAARGCILLPRAEGESCDDGDACSEDDTCRQGGRCSGAPRDCDPGEPCRVGSCDPASGCVTEDAPDDTACVPADPCAVRGVCADGACVGVGSTCDCREDADCAAVQPEDRCLGTYVCVDSFCRIDPQTVPQCPDPAPGACAESRCDPGTGTCADVPLDEGAGCDDDDPCTTGDACDGAGSCRGTAACDDGDPCTEDTCAAATGDCGHTAVPLGTACDDGAAATVGDACVAGRCAGWTLVTWRDRSRATRLEGVTWSRDAFYAIGRSHDDARDADEAFVARLDADGGPAPVAGAVRNDTVYARVNGGVAVGAGGAVTVHEDAGWARSTGLEEALAGLAVPPDALSGVWPATWTVPPDGGSATLRAVWFAGRSATAEPASPWLARCAGPADAAWSCTWLGEEPAFRDEGGLDAVAGFVSALDPCPDASAPLCADPDRSMAFAAGPSAGGAAAPTLYRGRPDGNDESWRDTRTLDGLTGAFRDLLGSGPEDVWGVGTDGLLVRWNGAGWVPGAAAVAGWDLNGVWSSGSVVLVAASQQERDGGPNGDLVLRLSLFVGVPADATFDWRRVDLLRTVVCEGAAACPAVESDSGALADVWARGGNTGGTLPSSIVAVGHRAPADGSPHEALVFRLDLE